MISRFRTWLASAIKPQDEPTPTPGKERTSGQNPGRAGALVTAGNGALTAPVEGTIQTWRQMRMQPTIALARSMFTAPIRMLKFTIDSEEGTPQQWIDFLQKQYDAIYPQMMHDVLYAFDYGWQAFEEVYGTDEETGLVIIDRLKLLIADTTHVVLKKDTGRYDGLTNGGKQLPFTGTVTGGTYVPPEYTWWYVYEKEGDNWYGESIMERARCAYNRWREADARGDRYLTSVAGPIPMVQYPMGEVQGPDGQDLRTMTIAQNIIEGLSRCKGVAMPNVITAYADQLLNAGADPAKLEAWKISFLEAQGAHGQEFLQQQHAKEVDMLRSWLIPERAAIEGQFGTKAESETHAEHVLDVVDVAIRDIFASANRYISDRLLYTNFGPQAVGQVWLTPEEIDTDKRELLKMLIQSSLGAPVNSDLLLDLLDIEDAFDTLGLPKAEDMAEKLNEEVTVPEPAPPLIGIPPTMQPPPPPPNTDEQGEDEADQTERLARMVHDSNEIIRDIEGGLLSRTAGRKLLEASGVTPERAAYMVAGIDVTEPEPPPPAAPPEDDGAADGDLSYVDTADGRRWFERQAGQWIEVQVNVRQTATAEVSTATE